MKQAGFFDVEERLARLSGLGDQLEVFSRAADFEVFRAKLEKALAYSDAIAAGSSRVGAMRCWRRWRNWLAATGRQT